MRLVVVVCFCSFLVSFVVDARGGAMCGCRHSGVRFLIPPDRACMPTRVTCKLIKKDRLVNPPPLMENEALACRIVQTGPVGTQFLGYDLSSLSTDSMRLVVPAARGHTSVCASTENYCQMRSVG